MPKISFSVIIPVYNRETQIKHCVESVLAQNYDAFEVIVVDDGSTDNTATVVKQISDPRLKYIYQENKERGAARNNGWNRAEGDYITFLDSDDEFLPGHLSMTATNIEAEPGFDVYCTSYLKEGPKGLKHINIPADIKGHLPDGNFLSCNGVFVSAGVKDFRFSEVRELSGLEDWLLWLQLSVHKKMLALEQFSSRMNHHGSRSVLQTDPATLEKRFAYFFDALETENKTAGTFAHSILHIKASGESYMALHLAMVGYKTEARRHLKNALRLRPGWIFTRRYFAILKYLWT